MGVRVKRLVHDEQFIHYQTKVDQHIGVRFDLSYLKGGHVYALYLNGEMIGGYAVILDGPFRVLTSIERKVDLSAIDMRKTAEVTGLWLDKRKAKNYSLVLWVHMLFGLLRSRRSQFVFAYTLQKTGLEKLYSPMNTEVLYRGLVEALEGMKGDDYESIELMRVSDLVKFPFKNPSFVTRRVKAALNFRLKPAPVGR